MEIEPVLDPGIDSWVVETFIQTYSNVHTYVSYSGQCCKTYVVEENLFQKLSRPYRFIFFLSFFLLQIFYYKFLLQIYYMFIFK